MLLLVHVNIFQIFIYTKFCKCDGIFGDVVHCKDFSFPTEKQTFTNLFFKILKSSGRKKVNCPLVSLGKYPLPLQ